MRPCTGQVFHASEYYNVAVTVAYDQHESQSIPKRFDKGRLIIKQTVLFDAKMNAFEFQIRHCKRFETLREVSTFLHSFLKSFVWCISSYVKF